jgi:peptidoglycan/LPS O-acetylase OafA/YrhL
MTATHDLRAIVPPATDGVETPLLRRVMPELDQLRGVAVLSVLLYHLTFWSNNSMPAVSRITHAALLLTREGWIGVDLFFVLSGFLITGILLDQRGSPRYFRTFYTRRALRILPALYALLAILLAQGAPASFVAWSALFCANVAPLWGVPMAYGPLWSLAVEEHFYFVWPALAAFLSRRTLFAIAMVIVVASPLARALTFPLSDRWSDDRLTWLTTDGLALGAAIAIALREWRPSRRDVARVTIAVAVLVAIGFAVGAPFGILSRKNLLGRVLVKTLLAFGSGALIVGSLLLGTRRHRPWRGPRVLEFLGTISYGLYLIHILAYELGARLLQRFAPSLAAPDGRPTPLFARVALGGVLAVGVATLSRFTFEDRFLRLKSRLAP